MLVRQMLPRRMLASRAFSSTKIDVSKLEITLTTEPKTQLPKEQLTFGTTFSDHMLEVDWTAEEGWGAPKISPYHNLSVDPAASVFHYALECFEGMKAYRDDEGNVRMFRPDCNMERMNTSMERLALPNFDGDGLVECMKELLKIDKDWIPQGEGYSLYIRPTGISTHPCVGVARAASAKIYVILSPVGPYYPEGFAPVKLLAGDEYVRAWPGGTGDTKIGGNYGPTILPQSEAAAKGFQQLMWLFADGDEHLVTEVGTMNVMFVWTNLDGELELVTAPLNRGDILPGVTRRSVLELVEGWGTMKVTERNITMREVVAAVDEGRMVEAFGCGTAVVVSPIELINYNGKDLQIPLELGNVGKTAQRLWDEITGIQLGRIEHEWSVKVE